MTTTKTIAPRAHGTCATTENNMKTIYIKDQDLDATANLRHVPAPQVGKPDSVLGQFIAKPAKCKVCKSLILPPSRPTAIVCSGECAASLALSERLKTEKHQAVKAAKLAAADRRDTRAKLDKLKSRAQWAKEAQTSFNAWVRARDAGMPCISCGRHHQGQNHAGHYLSVGARPELRYEPLNVWLQCAPCNTHLSGNAVLYRQALLVKIGQEKLDWLEGPHPIRHYSIEELREIKQVYAAKAKALKCT